MINWRCYKVFKNCPDLMVSVLVHCACSFYSLILCSHWVGIDNQNRISFGPPKLWKWSCSFEFIIFLVNVWTMNGSRYVLSMFLVEALHDKTFILIHMFTVYLHAVEWIKNNFAIFLVRLFQAQDVYIWIRIQTRSIWCANSFGKYNYNTKLNLMR